MRCETCRGTGLNLIRRKWHDGVQIVECVSSDGFCPTCHGSGITSCCNPDHVPDMAAKPTEEKE